MEHTADRAVIAKSGLNFDEWKSARYFSNFNGIRFICIAAVLWHHAPIWRSLEGPFSQFLARGFLGVDFFFVLSGFLITTLLLREEERDGSFSLKGFYWRRFLRIIPVYFFVITAVCAYEVLLKGKTELLSVIPYYYLFLSNFLTEHISILKITWSLSMEEQYYMIWPLLLMVLPRRYLVPALLGLILFNLIAVLGALTPLGITAFEAGPLLFAMPSTTYAPILMGSLAAYLLHQRASYDVITPLLRTRAMPVFCFLVLLVAIYVMPEPLIGFGGFTIAVAMTLLLINVAVTPNNFLAPVLTNPFVARIGEISYGVYLYHLLALDITTRLLNAVGMNSAITLTVAYIIMSLIISEISFRTLEKFFMRFR